MRVIKAGYERITEQDPIKKIEQVARVCYKSEDKICEGSAVKMVRALVRSKHYAMLEHGSIIIDANIGGYIEVCDLISQLTDAGEIVELRCTAIDKYIISGNMRAWLEFLENCIKHYLAVNEGLYKILMDEKYKPIFDEVYLLKVVTTGSFRVVAPENLVDAERLVHEDITIKWICDRGVSHEIVRHRKASFAQESTRYCNYGKSGDVTFIRPCYFKEDTPEMDNWLEICMLAERSYLDMLKEGRSPQEARSVLPNSLKTEIVMTANLREWRHFFKLRACGTTGKPHPQMLEVAVPLLMEVNKKIPVIFEDLEPMIWEPSSLEEK